MNSWFQADFEIKEFFLKNGTFIIHFCKNNLSHTALFSVLRISRCLFLSQPLAGGRFYSIIDGKRIYLIEK